MTSIIILSSTQKKNNRSFAYYTIRERLPVILTQVIDQLSRDKDEIAAKYDDAEVCIYLLFSN